MEKNVIGGVESSKDGNGNIIIRQPDAGIIFPLYRNDKYLIDQKTHDAFVKNVEQQCRTSLEYCAYLKYLKEELDPPLNHCMVYSSILADFAKVEMHHGVILNLYDIVEVISNWNYKNGHDFTSATIAYMVMEEHRLNNVQVIMLSKSVHMAMHPKKGSGAKPKFIDYRMCHGNIVEFLKKYYVGLTHTHMMKFRSYFDAYEDNMEKSDGFFEEFITKWNDEIMREG